MKRFVCWILCLSMVLCLFGCKAKQDGDSTTFYYCRSEYVYGAQDGVIAPEQRELSTGTSDLKSLLALYLIGPLDESLTSPFIGTKLSSVETEGDQLFIVLTDPHKAMTDARFSLACACMTMTCLELTDASQVTITCADRSVTMSRDNLLLFDGITPTETNTEETQ